MRILLSANHRYPAFRSAGAGRRPLGTASRSGHYIHDLIAMGLAELGHEVLYLLPQGADQRLPEGVALVRGPVLDVDILHTIAYHDEQVECDIRAGGVPWVATCHMDMKLKGRDRVRAQDNWIFVSQSLARSHWSNRFVLNGIDPAPLIYAESKENYFLFISSLELARGKGLDIALALSRETGIELVVAGTTKTSALIEEVSRLCANYGATFAGEVRGREKAALLSGAKALLFPTQLNEAFGLAMVEALMSGTPVVCSDQGACTEVIGADTGFVCRDWPDYLHAVARLDTILPRVCRQKALSEFHYLTMAANYVKQYENEIDDGG